MQEQEPQPTIKKMEVESEEVFENANSLPPDPNTRERFLFPGIYVFVYGNVEGVV